MSDDRIKKLLGYTVPPYVELQGGEGTTSPAVVFSDADYEVGDGKCGLHESAKQANEPAIPYVRMDAFLAQAARIERLEAALQWISKRDNPANPAEAMLDPEYIPEKEVRRARARCYGLRPLCPRRAGEPVMSAPDRIWVEYENCGADDCNAWVRPEQYGENLRADYFHAEFLRANPARLHAEELAEALREAVPTLEACASGGSRRSKEALAFARAVFAKLEKEEGK